MGQEGSQMECLELDPKFKLDLDRKGGDLSGEPATWRKVWLSGWAWKLGTECVWGREEEGLGYRGWSEGSGAGWRSAGCTRHMFLLLGPLSAEENLPSPRLLSRKKSEYVTEY